MGALPAMDTKRIIFTIAFGFAFSSAHSATFTVNSTASSGSDANNGDGICATSAGVCTFRAAFTEADALPGPDVINLPAGTFTPVFREFISDELEVVGAGLDATFINRTGFVVDTNLPVAFKNVTIQNGGTQSDNAIFLNANADLTLSDVHLIDFPGSVIISSSAGFNQLTINNSLIESGMGTGITTTFGGGLYLWSGNTTFNNSTVRGSTADFGGGIYLNGTTMTIRNSTVSGNSSTTANNVNGGFGGGGIQIAGSGTLTVENTTISGNSSVSSGAGIVINDGAVSLYNATITANRSDSDGDLAGFGGGVIASSAAFSATNTLQMRNSIVAGNVSILNSAIDCSSANLTITSFGYNLLGTGSDTDCQFTPAAGDQLGTVLGIDPQLGTLSDNGGVTQTHALQAGSPAIDSGNPSACTDSLSVALTTDQRGFVRPLDGGTGSLRCDIGAYETNPLPSADAGADQTVQFGESVTLSGSNSSALAGIASFSWVETPSSSVVVNNATSATADFSAPSVPGNLTFNLTVTDNNGLTDTDSVVISVNAPPVANAGPDQVTNGGSNAILNGTNSSDADGAITNYSWRQTSGVVVSLTGGDTGTPSFTTPNVPGEVLTFELTVTDDTGATSIDTVSVTVNTPPIANAGPDQSISSTAGAGLDGSGSSDSDGSIQSVSWQQTSGATVGITSPNSLTSQLTFPSGAAGDFIFQLTVTDDAGAAATDSVVLTVSATPSGDSNSGGGGGGGGAFNLIGIIGLLIIVIARLVIIRTSNASLRL